MNLMPLTEAVAKISAKTPVGSVLRSAEWAEVPLALRERAQFSAGVESARVLQAIQERMEGLIKLQREQLASGDTATFDRSSFIDAIRAIARDEGLTPEDPAKRGTIQDITSVPRLGMIFDMQQAQAQEYARWKMDQTEGALLLYPAQEFVRIEPRRVPRQNWPERWAAAGGRFFEGRMIALKTDPVWEKLSRFGTPWPPFDFNSGMGIEDVDRDEAVRLGVMAADQGVEPIVKDFNERLEASAEGLSQELRDVLKTHFGDQIAVEGDRIAWQSNQGAAYESKRASEREMARSVFQRMEASLGGLGRGIPASETIGGLDESARHQAAVQAAAVAAGRKPIYHEQLGEWAEPLAAALRKALPENVPVQAEAGHVIVWRPEITTFQAALSEIRAGRGNDLLGYGPTPLNAPGNVTVLIKDEGGHTVGGFQTVRAGAALFAKARAQDFADATGRPHTYVIGGRP